MTGDPFDLRRFVEAQSATFETALMEIKSGAKKSHWMWFIFPQIAGLGSSPMAKHYAIATAAEARAYLDHPVLGDRLRECVVALQDLPESSARSIFGEVDAQKLLSSLTLFELVSDELLFAAALDRWFDGERDPATIALIGVE